VRGGHCLAVKEKWSAIGLDKTKCTAILSEEGSQEGGEDLPGVVMGGAVGGLPRGHRQVEGLVWREGKGAIGSLRQGNGGLPVAASAAGQSEKGQHKGQDDSKGAFHGTFSFRGSVVLG